MDSLGKSQEKNEIQLLRLIKLLQQKTESSAFIDCYILTLDNYRVVGSLTNPYGGGVTGLAYSIAQGDHRFLVRNIDISQEDLVSKDKQEALLKMILSETASDRGDVIKFKSGRRYQQIFFKLDWGHFKKESGLKKGGVYVILGGSGAVGGVITRYLIQEYQAKVIWIGRKPETSCVVQEKLEPFHELGVGEHPWYIQADVTQLDSMKQAVKKIKEKYSSIHGAIFSGVVFQVENSVAQTTETDFEEIFDVKAKGSLYFYEAFRGEPLDFMCYFSSAQSFSFLFARDTSGYAIGTTFSDTFIKSIERDSHFPVGIINWGYWKITTIGTVLEKQIANRFGLISDHEGFQFFEKFTYLLQRKILNQILCLRASELVQKLMNFNQEDVISIGEQSPDSLIQSLWKNDDSKREEIETLTKNYNSEEINGWIAKLLFVQMRHLGIFSQRGVLEESATLREKAGVVDKYDRWWRECLNILESRGYVHSDAEQVQVAKDVQLEEKEEVWRAWNSRKESYLRDPGMRTLTILANDCLQKLPEIVRGTILVTDILFPDGSMEKMEGLYKNSAISDYFNTVVAEVAKAYIKQRIEADPQAKIRIIEVGAGTGGTTSIVLPQLRSFQDFIQEYCYTDLSKAFLRHGEEHYEADYPYMAYKLWDIEQPLADQEIQLGSYDIVIAANVLHATKSIRNTLRNTKAALARNGILILNEISQKEIFASVIFGLIDGWSLSEDDGLRIPGSPALYPEAWQEALEQEGFDSVLFPVEAAHVMGQQIVVAESDGVIRQKMSHVTEKKPIDNTKENKPAIISEEVTKTISRPIFEGAEGTKSLKEYVASLILESLSESLKISKRNIDRDIPFSDYGIDSILGGSFVKQVSDKLGITMSTAILFDYTSVERLTNYVSDTYKDQIKIKNKDSGIMDSDKSDILKQTQPRKWKSLQRWRKQDSLTVTEETVGQSKPTEIAVIGISGQFPGARDVDTFWQNLIQGRDGVGELPAHYLDQDKYFSLNKQSGKTYCKWGGILKERDCFDPLFFNLFGFNSPRLASF